MIVLLLVEVVLLISLSAVCSGLNIALMSLDLTNLKRKAKLGNGAAKRILPIRKNSHLALAAILLTNVAVISATSLVLDSELNGIVAGIMSTLLIVIFGEVIPQALFARHALAVCAWLAPFIRLMIIITYPVSKPLQLLLDKLFAHQATQLQSRRELGIIIGEHLENKKSELDDDEVEIMRGALALSEKRVRDIMTPFDHVYWVTPETLIDADKIDEIKSRNRSRIPVFNNDHTKSYGLLLMKDLVDVDFDDHPQKVCTLPIHATKVVGSMTALDTMFRKFIGAHAHLMPVERDDTIIGIVTIEDLIEEIIGHEIEDEGDFSRLAIPKY